MSEGTARRFFGDGDPLGRTMSLPLLRDGVTYERRDDARWRGASVRYAGLTNQPDDVVDRLVRAAALGRTVSRCPDRWESVRFRADTPAWHRGRRQEHRHVLGDDDGSTRQGGGGAATVSGRAPVLARDAGAWDSRDWVVRRRCLRRVPAREGNRHTHGARRDVPERAGNGAQGGIDRRRCRDRRGTTNRVGPDASRVGAAVRDHADRSCIVRLVRSACSGRRYSPATSPRGAPRASIRSNYAAG